MVLRPVAQVSLPQPGGFDHGGVYEANGWVYVAHTSAASVEVFDGVTGKLVKTVRDDTLAEGYVRLLAGSTPDQGARFGFKNLIIRRP